MKLKIYTLLLALSVTWSLQSCDNDDDGSIAVPAELQSAFSSKFPNAANVKWETKSGYYVADFYDGYEASAWFTQDGKWQMTETDIPYNALPQAVKMSFENSEYASWKRDDIDKLERTGLPQKLHFIHSEELRQLYPNLEPKCREHAICQKYGAVFIIGIGCQLGDGKKHDGRAPDYDDYTTKGLNDLPGLNGDLLLWDNVLQRSIELSSMGIRVDKEALQRQLKEEKEEKRLELYFHKRLMNDTLPLSIGGGIGQSRLCMFYLRKAHIGEIQASIWPEDMRKECEELEIHLI